MDDIYIEVCSPTQKILLVQAIGMEFNNYLRELGGIQNVSTKKRSKVLVVLNKYMDRIDAYKDMEKNGSLINVCNRIKGQIFETANELLKLK